jgi:hypothetical protein
MEAAALAQDSTWAVVLDEVLEVLGTEYAATPGSASVPPPGGSLRTRSLLVRARSATDRLLWSSSAAGGEEVNEAMDRLMFAVSHRRLPAAEVEPLIHEAQRMARRFRRSTLTRIGAFVVEQLLRRSRAPHDAAAS